VAYDDGGVGRRIGRKVEDAFEQKVATLKPNRIRSHATQTLGGRKGTGERLGRVGNGRGGAIRTPDLLNPIHSGAIQARQPWVRLPYLDA
jgi:hypothetical protein